MRLERAELPDMGDEGQKVRQRRERLGLTQAQLGEEAGGEGTPIHRNTIRAIEDGLSGNRAKLAAVLRALDDLEREAGIDASAGDEPDRPRNVVITLGEGRGRVVVEGAIEDLVELEAAAERLFRLGESQ